MAEMNVINCMACGRPMLAKKEVLDKIPHPMTFCYCCDSRLDPLFKRHAVQNAWMGQTLAAHHELLLRLQNLLPAVA